MGRFETYRESVIAQSYDLIKARVLQSALELDVFERIGTEAKTVRTLAQEMGADERALELFLNALVSLGWLEGTGHGYRNTKYGLEVFLKDKPFYVGDTLLLHSASVADWLKLSEVVKTGKPVQAPEFLDLENPARVRLFIRAMHNTAVGHASTLAKKLPLYNVRTFLDLGGGSGAFTIEFLKANPGLQATLFDLPTTLEVAKEYVANAGLSERVQFRAGDFMKDPLEGTYGFCFLSHVVHGLSVDENKALFQKIFPVVTSGGRLVIQDFFLNTNRQAPQFGAVFSLNMLLHTTSGRSYTFDEVTEWLKAAGFDRVEPLFLKLPRSIGILMASKT